MGKLKKAGQWYYKNVINEMFKFGSKNQAVYLTMVSLFSIIMVGAFAYSMTLFTIIFGTLLLWTFFSLIVSEEIKDEDEK